jgi:hypothetical protein
LPTKRSLLKEAFNQRFWLEDRGYFALGLDGEKKVIDSLTSNIGHCLWSGIVEPDKARNVADHLLSAEMFTGGELGPSPHRWERTTLLAITTVQFGLTTPHCAPQVSCATASIQKPIL